MKLINKAVNILNWKRRHSALGGIKQHDHLQLTTNQCCHTGHAAAAIQAIFGFL